jgi:alkyldihydroxyacetonephosphate synthase
MTQAHSPRERKFWGWGWEGEGLSDQEVNDLGDEIRSRFDIAPQPVAAPPALSSLGMPNPRLAPPASLAELCRQDPRERAVHTLGKSYDDLVRGIRGDYRHAPDIVAFPRDE